ncbi:hypothetical protein ABL78_4362 [Leptomonas seymouri]|uniref:Uncharacterized protein n=1 Tax=Leptomonas seymouri TaxID=5684 RepID=A0A0N0P5Z9_LEPSE|nr:hypothetical protein ABL78_4362 [Leptomonas seymouri]|eukprot:KPI86587.1 hypothetical protein ABL78_4362 [Leptomonas seymouri]
MLRTAFLLGGRMRRLPVTREGGRKRPLKRATVVAQTTRKQNEVAAERQFLKMIAEARTRRHRQLRQAIKMALAARPSEPPVTKRDGRYATNRNRAIAELERIDDEKARAALKSRKAAASLPAEEKAKESVASQKAKKKIEREARKARAKAAEEAAEARFFAELQRLRLKQSTRVQAIVDKKARAKKGVAAEEKKDENEKTAVEAPSMERKEEQPIHVAAASPEPAPARVKPAKQPTAVKKHAAKREKSVELETTKVAAEPPVVPKPLRVAVDAMVEDDVPQEAPTPPPPASPEKAVAQRRPRRPSPPPAAAATTEEVAEVHDEFVAQLEKAKGRAAAAPMQAAAAPPARATAAPTKSWVMPENSTGLFRL